jgi:hypothetical protein
MAVGRLEEVRHQLEQRALAAAGRADQGDELALVIVSAIGAKARIPSVPQCSLEELGSCQLTNSQQAVAAA